MANKLKRFVNDPEFKIAFDDFINSKIKIAQTTLSGATEPHIMYRLQGTITAYNRLLTIREEVNSLEK